MKLVPNKKRALFKVSCGDESYFYTIYVPIEVESAKDISDNMLRKVIEEANRFIEFYYRTTDEYDMDLERYRKYDKSVITTLPKFSPSQIESLANNQEINAGGFYLEFMDFLKFR